MVFTEHSRSRRSVRRGVVVRAALIGVLVLASFPPAAALAAEPTVAGESIEVSGTIVDVSALPAARGKPSAAEVENGRVTTPRSHHREGKWVTKGLVLSEAPTTADYPPPMAVSTAGTQSVAEGFSAFSVPGPGDSSWPADVNGAAVGNRLLVGSRSLMESWTIPGLTDNLNSWQLTKFFAIPAGEYYWGATVASSPAKARFVAAVPSFDSQAKACARGWLNIAVSNSSDPAGSWTRFRIPMTDAYADLVNIGISDDKVVFTVNEWDLAASEPDCIDGSWKGSRIRVVDWADLIDGGTLTVRDVSPTPRTSYYNWLGAVNVAGTSSSSAGATLRLVASRNAGGNWGHLAYATVTGSAKAGTAALVGNVDLTEVHSVRPLIGPPSTIAAFPDGNGYQDERPISVVARGTRLWLSVNDTCRLDLDPDFRACGRFIQLDVSTTVPSVAEDVTFVGIERDTFLPIVGVTRDGSSFATMSASSAVEHDPVDQYVVYRKPGILLSDGPHEAAINRGTGTIGAFYNWGNLGSIVADPVHFNQAYAIYPVLYSGFYSAGQTTRLKGGLTGSPGGTFVFAKSSGWTNQSPTLFVSPDLTSPITWVRVSSSPEVEDTGAGPRLVKGRTLASAGVVHIGLNDPVTGGTWPVDTFTVYMQWQTVDGTWSTPVSKSIRIDTVNPTVSRPALRFTGGKVGKTVPVRISWTAADSLSGLESVFLSRYQRKPIVQQTGFTYSPATTTVTQAPTVGGTYDWELAASDRAGNSSGYTPRTRTAITVAQGTSAGLSYKKTWSTSTSTKYLGGSTRYSSTAGARVTYTFTGRAFGFVSTKAKTRGKAELWVDGVKAATIDLYSPTAKYRRLVWQRSWSSVGTHTVQIRVLGTPGRPRIDADAFVKF